MINNQTILRPLLFTPKHAILQYADKYKIEWREDPTNRQTDYLRNYLRHEVLAKSSPSQKHNMLNNIEKVAEINKATDELIEKISQNIITSGNTIGRILPYCPSEVTLELMSHWLRELGIRDFDSKILVRLVTAIKTALPNTYHDVLKGWQLKVHSESAHFVNSSKSLV